MKRFKLSKFVDAEPMFQANAERVVGKINNLTHGNDGYLVDDPETGLAWVPKSVFEKDYMPAHTHTEKLNLMMAEAQVHLEELKAYTKYGKPEKHERDRTYMAIRRISTYIEDLQKLLNLQK